MTVPSAAGPADAASWDDGTADRRFRVVPAAYVYLRREGQVLLQLRQGTGFMDGHWAAAAAGHVEAGESVQAAAAREAREELGVVVDPADLVPVTTMHRGQPGGPALEQRVDFFFTTQHWKGKPRIMEPEKSSGLDWFPLDELPEPVVPHELQVLMALRAEFHGSGEVPAIMTHGW